MDRLHNMLTMIQFSLAVAGLAQCAAPVAFLDGGMLAFLVALTVSAASARLEHEDSDCEDRLVSDDDRHSTPASTIGDEMDMCRIADLDDVGFQPDEPKPMLLCAAETSLDSLPSDGSADEPTAPAPHTHLADATHDDPLDGAICASAHAHGCHLVIIDQSSGEVGAYSPASSSAYNLMLLAFQKHFAVVQQAWNAAQAFRDLAMQRLQQAQSYRQDATQIGCSLVLNYICQTVWELELQAQADLREAAKWDWEYQVRYQGMTLAVGVAQAVAEKGLLESVFAVPPFGV
ncbi:hypothetical protein HXX76_014629 [Chlamydomonas incerta]|uniref:Uncharacterized protein n=1 Tax=Chlamydomonas incerta TaxID=51695 RepID=A0A835SEU8_CHLIN|nr:hypothetical protein HXX76_014629 [Chlamydomonas incerta]|eukprot:KAG2424246.1 hypothetical protein HXX76_014629 [Chlamydomonas incerta]